MAVSSHNNEAIFFTEKYIEKGEIFEKNFTRSNKAINISNLFLTASSVVYHNSARQKNRGIGKKSSHSNVRPNRDSQTVL